MDDQSYSRLIPVTLQGLTNAVPPGIGIRHQCYYLQGAVDQGFHQLFCLMSGLFGILQNGMKNDQGHRLVRIQIMLPAQHLPGPLCHVFQSIQTRGAGNENMLFSFTHVDQSFL